MHAGGYLNSAKRVSPYPRVNGYGIERALEKAHSGFLIFSKRALSSVSLKYRLPRKDKKKKPPDFQVKAGG